MSAALLSMSLTACGGNGGNSNGPEKDPNEVSVFVLSGQSNMEGNTSFEGDVREGSQTIHHDFLAEAFEKMGLEDVNVCKEGIQEVVTSSYCAGYGQLNHNNLTNNSSVNATNTTNQIDGAFVPTKVGLGLNSSKMGPELGAAYALREYADADKPIYFIKLASGGSGFAQSGTDYNWPVKDASGNFPEINLYHTFLKPFINNNLKHIKDEGWTPVIKGWLWHQGESDCADEKIPVYAQRLSDMVSLFREDFAEYARDEDGDNIAFIDGMVYQGSNPKTNWHTPDLMNAEKQKFADSNDMNFIVDTYGNAEEKTDENELKPGNPGGDSMHYNTESSFRLGMAYGQVIIDNDLLD